MILYFNHKWNIHICKVTVFSTYIKYIHPFTTCFVIVIIIPQSLRVCKYTGNIIWKTYFAWQDLCRNIWKKKYLTWKIRCLSEKNDCILFCLNTKMFSFFPDFTFRNSIHATPSEQQQGADCFFLYKLDNHFIFLRNVVNILVKLEIGMEF